MIIIAPEWSYLWSQALEQRWNHWNLQTLWMQASYSGFSPHILFLRWGRRLSAGCAAASPTEIQKHMRKRGRKKQRMWSSFKDFQLLIQTFINLNQKLTYPDRNSVNGSKIQQGVKRVIFVFRTCVTFPKWRLRNFRHLRWWTYGFNKEGSKTASSAAFHRLAGWLIMIISLFKVPWPLTYRSLPSLPSARLCFPTDPCCGFHCLNNRPMSI